MALIQTFLQSAATRCSGISSVFRASIKSSNSNSGFKYGLTNIYGVFKTKGIIPVNRRLQYVFDSQIPFPNRIEVSLFVELAVLSVVVFGESDREFISTKLLGQ